MNTSRPRVKIIVYNSNISSGLNLQLRRSPIIHFISLSRFRYIHLSLPKTYLLPLLHAKSYVAMVSEITLKKNELGADCIVKLRRKKAENICEGICSENRCPNFCTQCLNGCDDTAKHCKLEKGSYGHPALVLGVRERYSITYVTFVIVSSKFPQISLNFCRLTWIKDFSAWERLQHLSGILEQTRRSWCTYPLRLWPEMSLATRRR